MCGDAVKSRCVVLAGGGTGGHLAPGLAIADELRRRLRGARVVFAGTGRPLEEHLVPPAGFELLALPVAKLPRSPGQVLLFPLRLWHSLRSAGAVLRDLKPDIVVGLEIGTSKVCAVVAEVPGAVDGVIERALSRDPDARWPSGTALKDALQAAAGTTGGDPGRTSGATTGRPASPPAPGMTAPLATPSLVASKESARPAPREAFEARPGPTKASTHAPGTPNNPIRIPVGGADDNVERWLVHKDGLDFGPFSMTQLRVQIERGEVLGEHVLMDNESGARCLVKEYPGLGDLAKRAHRHIEQARRAQAEQRSAKSEKKKSFATTLIVGLVLLTVLGGVAFYVISRRDSAGGRLASREEEAEIESFLKGVKISGLKASVRRGGHRSAGSPSGGSAEDFNNDANFGDASKGFTEGDQTLDDDQIQNTMMANYRKLIPCIVHGGVNEIAMEFVVRGNGKVSAVKVNGQRAGALPACLLGRMQSFNFPKFNGSKTIASWSMSMGR